jgi:type III secretion protein J
MHVGLTTCLRKSTTPRKKRLPKVLLIALLFLSGCREQIIHDLSETEANRFLTFLHDDQIDARKEKQPDGKWCVSVPEADGLVAIKLLETARLLRPERASAETKSSLISSREDQRLQTQNIMSGRIEDTLRSIRGVLEAHVHLNLPPNDPIFGTRLSSGSASGSVLLVVTDSLRASKDEIVSLVSGAAGVEPKQISVVMTNEDEARRSIAPDPRLVSPQNIRKEENAIAGALNLTSRQYSFWAQLFLVFAAGLALLLWRLRPRETV